jgi:hypothetical protein
MISFRLFRTRRILSEREWLLTVGETPPLAAHLVIFRRGYMHHGIHIGAGKVVHYAGLSRNWTSGPVEETTLTEFAHNRPVWVRPHLNPRFERHEIIERARSRLGESRYRILSNNCEHLCEWCVQGESRSWQVEALRWAPRRMLQGALRALSVRCYAWRTGPDNWAV